MSACLAVAGTESHAERLSVLPAGRTVSLRCCLEEFLTFSTNCVLSGTCLKTSPSVIGRVWLRRCRRTGAFLDEIEHLEKGVGLLSILRSQAH